MDDNITDISWAAGIIDGEGCITIHRRNPSKPNRSPYYRLDIKVKMVHKPAIERLRDIFQIGTVNSEPPGKTNRRMLWKWLVYGKDCEKVIHKILPYLTVKRDDAEIGLSFLPLNKRTAFGHYRVDLEVLNKRDELYRKMQAVKQYEWKE